MRLTLRTLLAYLDEILDPQDAEVLGKKIHDSEFASNLVHQIRSSVRRLRLDAPPIDAQGIGGDLNTVAEYLDNTLPPDQVPILEKVCLDHENHLGEVASCHQILTLVLGQAAHVSEPMRRRIYQIAPSADPSRPIPGQVTTPLGQTTSPVRPKAPSEPTAPSDVRSPLPADPSTRSSEGQSTHRFRDPAHLPSTKETWRAEGKRLDPSSVVPAGPPTLPNGPAAIDSVIPPAAVEPSSPAGSIASMAVAGATAASAPSATDSKLAPTIVPATNTPVPDYMPQRRNSWLKTMSLSTLVALLIAIALLFAAGPEYRDRLLSIWHGTSPSSNVATVGEEAETRQIREAATSRDTRVPERADSQPIDHRDPRLQQTVSTETPEIPRSSTEESAVPPKLLPPELTDNADVPNADRESQANESTGERIVEDIGTTERGQTEMDVVTTTSDAREPIRGLQTPETASSLRSPSHGFSENARDEQPHGPDASPLAETLGGEMNAAQHADGATGTVDESQPPEGSSEMNRVDPTDLTAGSTLPAEIDTDVMTAPPGTAETEFVPDPILPPVATAASVDSATSELANPERPVDDLPPEIPLAPEPSDEPKQPPHVKQGGQALLIFEAGRNEWSLVQPGTPLTSGDLLLSLPAFRASMELGSTNVCTFIGATRAMVTSSGVNLQDGHLVIELKGDHGTQSLAVFGQQFQVAAPPLKNAKMAIEAANVHVPGVNPDNEIPQRVFRIYAVDQPLTVRFRDQNYTIPHKQYLVVLNQFDPRVEPTVEVLPGWISGSDVPRTDEYSARMWKVNLAEITDPVGWLSEKAKTRQYNERALAARCLAELDQFEAIIAAINDNEQHAYWGQHYESFQRGLARGPETVRKIRFELEQVHPDDHERVFEMVRGYDERQLAAGGAAELVKALEHASLDYRVLAIENLRRITESDLAFHPWRLATKRATAVKSWKRKLSRGEVSYKQPPEIVRLLESFGEKGEVSE